MNPDFRKYFFPFQVAMRTQQIALLISSFGLAGTFASFGIEVGKRGLRFARVLQGSTRRLDSVFGRSLAKLFIRLGPTFIKLGQVLGTRPDFVGEHVAEELKVLFERVPAIPFREIQKILRDEIGKDNLRKFVKSIEPEPLASASLSQIHRAVLKDATPILLKIQKTNAAHLVRVDLAILEGVVRSVNPFSKGWNLLQMFEEFKSATLREIDYREEGKNIERFRSNYRKFFSDSDVVFPRFFPELTTQKVIALEPLHGRRVGSLRKGSTVARRAASLGVSAILEQIFDHGFFHADPHAGNLFFLEEKGRIGFIDLGLVGQLHPEDKRKFLKVLLAILKQDRSRLSLTLYDLGVPSVRTNYQAFDRAIQTLLDEVKKDGIENIKMDQLIQRLLSIARKNGIAIPNRYVLMIRSCLVIEGVARSLDPKISLAKIATPIVARSLLKTYNPLRLLKRLR